MTEIGTQWRLIDGVPTAWSGAPSLVAGAMLAGAVGRRQVADPEGNELVIVKSHADTAA